MKKRNHFLALPLVLLTLSASLGSWSCSQTDDARSMQGTSEVGAIAIPLTLAPAGGSAGLVFSGGILAPLAISAGAGALGFVAGQQASNAIDLRVNEDRYETAAATVLVPVAQSVLEALRTGNDASTVTSPGVIESS